MVDVKQDPVETPVVNYRKVLDALSSRGIIPDLKDVVFSGENGEEITINDLDLVKKIRCVTYYLQSLKARKRILLRIR